MKILFTQYIIYDFALASTSRISFFIQPECFHVPFSLKMIAELRNWVKFITQKLSEIIKEIDGEIGLV